MKYRPYQTTLHANTDKNHSSKSVSQFSIFPLWYKARKCEKANHFLPSYIFLLVAMKLNLHKKRYGVAINLRFHMIFEKKKMKYLFLLWE